MVIDCPDYLLYVWDKCAKDSIYYTYDDGVFTKESYQKMLNSSLLHFQVRPVCVQDLCDTFLERIARQMGAHQSHCHQLKLWHTDCFTHILEILD